MRRAVVRLTIYGALSVLLLLLLGTRLTGLPPLGALLDPVDGLYRTARLADAPPPSEIDIPGLENPVEVVWDQRGVPHLFGENDLDVVAALGFAVARDRLFQLDFLPRAASGRLSEALGEGGVRADIFLRSTGMEWGARKNMARIESRGGPELQLLEAYCRGINAYIDGLETRDLPFEFRLLGYRPDRCTPIQSLRLLQYMTYDLTYRTDEPAYAWLRERMDTADYDLLYPEHADFYAPIVPPSSGVFRAALKTAAVSPAYIDFGRSLMKGAIEGFIAGKGSNNFAVAGNRSATGKPILAGDMHLRVTLPAIWYEAHLVTPDMNTYGVTIPGAPLTVEAFNDHLGWTFTNTGSDQIDHYRLRLDPTETRYWYDGAWEDLEQVIDTIRVKGGPPIVDTLRYSRWGPVVTRRGEAVAMRWVAHDSSRTLLALLGMNRARTADEFQEALGRWDTPAQNILFADEAGNISIRSTGFMPIRRGGQGKGLLDGSTSDFEWIGRIPFDSLPHAVNPPRGYLTSTNQEPADSLYPYYLGHDWRMAYRSLRIDSLLRSKPRHSVDDLKSYQADVHAVQRDFVVPLIDTLSGLSARADSLRRAIVSWNGDMRVDRPEPLFLHLVVSELKRLTWDESEFEAAYEIDSTGDTLSGPFALPKPGDGRMFELLMRQPHSKWLDVRSTDAREDAAGLLRLALEEAAEGVSAGEIRWGDHRKIIFNFVIDNDAFRSLGRGPFEVPGYRETLSPAGDSLTTHSASQRLVVDFSQSPPRGWIVYPGGQSGNPFSMRYDMQIPTYLHFDYYDVLRPSSPAELDDAMYATHMNPRVNGPRN